MNVNCINVLQQKEWFIKLQVNNEVSEVKSFSIINLQC